MLFLDSRKDAFGKWNVKKGVYEPDPRQNFECHHIGVDYHMNTLKKKKPKKPGRLELTEWKPGNTAG